MPGEKREVSSIYNPIHKHIAIAVFNRATYSRILNFINQCEVSEAITYDLLLSGAILQKDFGGNYLKKKNTYKIPTCEYTGDSIGACRVSSDIIKSFGEHFNNHKYDLVVVVADRFETLPVAYAAALSGLPILHFQGGEVTGNIDEKIRHAVTKLSDYHFVSTKQAKKYVLALGEERNRVYQTGCPSLDIIRGNNIRRVNTKDRYFVCVFHPDTENLNENLIQAKELIEATFDYCAKYSSVCYLYYPNPDPGRLGLLDIYDEAIKKAPEYFRKAENQDPKKFLTELSRARFIIGNSSVGIREASYLGVPAINIGNRQNLRERSWNVIDLPNPTKENIIEALEHQHEIPRYDRSYLYGYGRAGQYAVVQLEKLDVTKKGPVTYPLMSEYHLDHFGQERHETHGHWRKEKG